MKSIYALAAIPAVLAAAAPDSSISFPTPSYISTRVTDEAQVTRIESAVYSDLSTFRASLTAAPEWSSFLSQLSTVLPSSEFEDVTKTGTADNAFFSDIGTATAAPTWWTKLDDSAQSYYTSVIAAEYSIMSKDFAENGATIAMPGLTAALIAIAGAVGGAALIL